MNQQNDSNNTEIADNLKVAFLGSLFSTVDELLDTYAAKLAIDETVKEQNSPQKINKKQEEQIMLLQKQVQELQQQMVDNHVKQAKKKEKELQDVIGNQEWKEVQKQFVKAEQNITQLEEKKEQVQKEILGIPEFDMRILKAETEKVGLFKKKEVKTGNYILTATDAQNLSERLKDVSDIEKGVKYVEELKTKLEVRELFLNEKEKNITKKESEISQKDFEIDQKEQKLVGKEKAIENGQKWQKDNQMLQKKVKELEQENSHLKSVLTKVMEIYEGLKVNF